MEVHWFCGLQSAKEVVDAATAGLLAIHSVCVEAKHRRQRVATRLLQAYKQFVVGSTPSLTSVRLICKQQLIPLYVGAGFQLVGPSDVVHGKDAWFEMVWVPQER
jgi:cyclin-dependent kinase-like